MEGRKLITVEDLQPFPLLELDADTLYMIFSLMRISDFDGSPIISRLFNEYFFHQYLVRKRFARHFPREFTALDKLDAVDWYQQFNTMSRAAYGEKKARMDEKMIRKFICVREHDVEALQRDEGNLTITLEDLYAYLKDQCNYSLVDLAYETGYQFFLDECYVKAVEYYQNDISGLPLEQRADDQKWSLLCWAIYLNQSDATVINLLEIGFAVDGIDHVNQSPLGIAAQFGRLRAVELLLSQHADVHRGRALESPLLLAAKHGHVEVCRALLNAGANIEGTDINGWTPLHHASKNGHVEVVALLFENGVEVNFRSANPVSGPTALHRAIIHLREHVVRFLLMHGAEPGLDFGLKLSTVLAVESCNLPILRLLVEEGAPLASAHPQKQSALVTAAEHNNVAALTYLLDQHLSVDFDELMHRAIISGSLDVFMLLVNRNILPANEDIFLALTARHNKQAETWKLVCYFLDEQRCDVNLRDADGRSLLIFLAMKGSDEQVQDLIRRGAEVNACDNNGVTALHVAAEMDNVEAAAALLRAGADIQAESKIGETPLMKAVRSSRFQMTSFLISNGAEPDYIAADGCSAFHVAALTCSLNAVQQLMLYNANPLQAMATTKDKLRQFIKPERYSARVGERLDQFLAKQPENFSVLPLDISRIMLSYNTLLLKELPAYMQRYKEAQDEKVRQANMDVIDNEFHANAHYLPVAVLPRQRFRLFDCFRHGGRHRQPEAEENSDSCEKEESGYLFDL